MENLAAQQEEQRKAELRMVKFLAELAALQEKHNVHLEVDTIDHEIIVIDHKTNSYYSIHDEE